MEEGVEEEAVILRNLSVFCGKQDGLVWGRVEVDSEGIGEMLQD